ncbi:hypothetical protein FNE76_06180, partial [Helicobacter mehlei]
YFPSSQICSTCGSNTGKKPLHIRNYALGMLDEGHAIKEKRDAFSGWETPEVTLVEASVTLAPLTGL